ncbi:AAA-ATPase vps4-associated 1 domain containing protein [Fusarium agapanthi]|uniref:AAA-ATPase vps4-associated 1 domain containing protein n=1 Tax=Fusarium agapanthi TaxID=1803897 RepID=A0A9P5E7U6_9HYPO|nr:AAA-ATPase vps4-associated 1 domain containing protein [Fusarium agapanthi]
MATTFPNIYTLRKVAETAAKACDICYKSSTSVLITPDQKDFFFVCPVHLKDRYFCTPKIDEEAAKRKREKELEEEKERVKKEYEEKQKKKKEKEEKKEKDKDKKEKDKDKKEKDGDKEKDKEEKDEKKDEDKDKEDKTPPAEEEPRVFELKTAFYQQRLLKKRQAEAAKVDRERASKPGPCAKIFGSTTSPHGGFVNIGTFLLPEGKDPTVIGPYLCKELQGQEQVYVLLSPCMPFLSPQGRKDNPGRDLYLILNDYLPYSAYTLCIFPLAMSVLFGETRCDGCQALFTADTGEYAILFYCTDYPTGNWKFLDLEIPCYGKVWPPSKRCTYLHPLCFGTILHTSTGRSRSQPEINCFRRAIGWRKLDLMGIFPKELDIPGPRRISQPSVARAATFSIQEPHFGRHFGRLHMELVDMVRSYCPDAYFWNVVQLRDLKGFASTRKRLTTMPLSRLRHWKRGDAAPLYGQDLKDPVCLRISLDSDGICEIQRLQDHPPPNHQARVKLRKYVLANEKDVESVNAFF